jgi:hypothetical protein
MASIEARLHEATARRTRYATIVTSPALQADARCGDADARHALDSAAEQLRTAERDVAALEAAQKGEVAP